MDRRACPIMRLDVVADRAAPLDRGTVEGLVAAAASGLSVDHRVDWCDGDGFAQRLRARGAATVVVPPGDVEVAALLGPGDDPPGPDRVLVRFDAHARERDTSPHLSAHLRGVGLGGITWAIRAAVHAARHPADTLRYGEHPDQFGQLRRPVGSGRPVALAVLIHGGYWRSRWQVDLMDALAIDLTERGIVSVNLEYRRPDRHGWQATLEDVRAGVRQAVDVAVGTAAAPVPLALIGHSAGGQLALQVAEERAASAQPVAVVASLAGVVDLHAADARELSDAAVRLALGGRPTEVPERYRAASPLARAHRRVPTVVAIGAQDDPDLVEMNRRFVTTATGAPIQVIELAGDHFDVIDPGTPLWRATLDALLGRLGGAGDALSLPATDRPSP